MIDVHENFEEFAWKSNCETWQQCVLTDIVTKVTFNGGFFACVSKTFFISMKNCGLISVLKHLSSYHGWLQLIEKEFRILDFEHLLCDNQAVKSKFIKAKKVLNLIPHWNFYVTLQTSQLLFQNFIPKVDTF